MGKGFHLLTLALLSVVSTAFGAAPDCTTTPIYQPQPNADDTNGASYFICLSTAGLGTLVECPDGLIFNAATKGCGAASPTTVSTSTCTAANQIILVQDDACLKYQQCEKDATTGDLAPTDHACTAPELFDPYLGKCVAEGEYVCGSTKPDCDNTAYEGKYLSVTGDCSSYFKCVDGSRVKGHCPTGKNFDFTSQMCLSASKSTCAGGAGSVGDLCKGKAKQFLADPNYCMGYYYCVDETTPYWDFCENGKYFNNGYCTSTKPSTCKCEGLTLPATGKVYVALADNTKYMICEKGKAPVEKTCPSGYTFDASEESCV